MDPGGRTKGDRAQARMVHEPTPIAGSPYVVPAQAIDAITFEHWLKSSAHAAVSGFVVSLAEGVTGVPNSAAPPDSDMPAALRGTASLLRALCQQIAFFPPEKQAMRYGNTAFRQWHARLDEELKGGALEKHGILGTENAAAAAELAPYLLESFGNPWRIDYGTGHELAFMCFLFCLTKLDLVTVPPPSAQRAQNTAGALRAEVEGEADAGVRDDRVAVVLVIFREYVQVMRALQRAYLLEPAGSHGVWGLDDYCFLPFLFGASQFAAVPGTPREGGVSTDAIHDEDIRRRLKSENMYMEAVDFVCSVKGPRLAEHSPMLNDISGIATWERIAAGLVRMYYAEVLGKRPVVHHLVFGSLLQWDGPRGVGEH